MKPKLTRPLQTLLLVALSAALALALVACGSGASPTPIPVAAGDIAPPRQAELSSPAPAETATPLPDPTATPEPTPAPTQTPVTAPTATPTAALSPVPTVQAEAEPTAQPDSGESRLSALADKAWSFLVGLTTDYSPRESATQEEKDAADFLLGEFRALGFQAELQPFTVELLASPVFSVSAPEEREFRGFPMALSGNGTATGLVVDAGKAIGAPRYAA